LLVEKALTELGLDWNHELKNDTIALLKPHGSIDWFDSDTTKIKVNLTSAVIEDIGKLRVFRHFRMPHIGSPITPIIVPPLVKKKWKYLEFDRIWRSTWRTLRTANEIHIMGFSLPPEDLRMYRDGNFRPRFLLSEAKRWPSLDSSLIDPD
jgi:hypothetical protein